MKVRFVCECCDRVFDEADVEDNEQWADLEALTRGTAHGIILQDQEGSGICLSALCEECSSEIGIADAEDIAFYREPLLN